MICAYSLLDPKQLALRHAFSNSASAYLSTIWFNIYRLQHGLDYSYTHLDLKLVTGLILDLMMEDQALFH